MDVKKRKGKILERWTGLKRERYSWDDHCKQISAFQMPGHGRWDDYQTNDGRKKHQYIKSGRPQKAHRNLASLMQGGLTSPSRPWFKLGLPDRDLQENHAVKHWLTTVEKQMYQAFSRSNFYDVIHSLYYEESGFGTAVQFLEEDFENYLRCYVWTFGEYWLDTNSQGRVDTLYRQLNMTARSIAQQFGLDNCSNPIKSAIRAGHALQRFKVLHVIQPRDEFDARKMDVLNKPYESSYWEVAEDNLLSESGYDEQPFQAPRWNTVSNDVYGRSPTMDALADIKQLYGVQSDIARGVHKMVDPPMLVPEGYNDQLNMMPGGQNYAPGAGAADTIKSLYDMRFDVASAEAFKQDLILAINEAYFNDLFIFLLERPNVTATEIVERHEEKLLLLGPVVERQQAELLDPTIDRAFGILNRAGLLPEPPPELEEGQELRVEYISLLAQAQKLVGTQAVERTMTFAGNAAQLNPEILDKVDFDEALDIYADLVGAPPRILRADDDMVAIRQQRQQAMQTQQAMVEADAMTEGAKKLSEIDTAQKSALTDVLGGGLNAQPGQA